MRNQFDEQLSVLHNSLIEMGALIERAIENTTKALVEQNVSLAEEVMNSDDIINNKEKEIESQCMKLLLRQQPVAKDLRKISTALKMVTDMERIGDQAADIAELCVFLTEQTYIKKLEHIPQMAAVTIEMVKSSIDAYIGKDIKLAEQVIKHDDEVDRLYIEIKRDLIDLIHQDVEQGEQAFDLLQIAKYYERIGDHAVNLAEWVIYSITGKHKKK